MILQSPHLPEQKTRRVKGVTEKDPYLKIFVSFSSFTLRVLNWHISQIGRRSFHVLSVDRIKMFTFFQTRLRLVSSVFTECIKIMSSNGYVIVYRNDSGLVGTGPNWTTFAGVSVCHLLTVLRVLIPSPLTSTYAFCVLTKSQH